MHPSGKQRLCVRCSTPFQSRWGYARCGSCRYQESYRDRCSCGARKYAKSELCRLCSRGPVSVPGTLSPNTAAWLTGLLEAEGTFVTRPRGGGHIRVQMTDLEVITRLKEIIPIGRLSSYQPKNALHKPSWMITVQRREYVIWLLKQVAPLLCSRRREAATSLLLNFRDPPDLPDATTMCETLDTPVALAWLAGVVEGDGVIRRGDLSVTSIDHDVVIRLQEISLAGRIYSMPRRQKNHRDYYVWRIAAKPEVRAVCAAIRPLMSSRRKAAIDDVLAEGEGFEPPQV
jgi:hypothetical protein